MRDKQLISIFQLRPPSPTTRTYRPSLSVVIPQPSDPSERKDSDYIAGVDQPKALASREDDGWFCLSDFPSPIRLSGSSIRSFGRLSGLNVGLGCNLELRVRGENIWRSHAPLR